MKKRINTAVDVQGLTAQNETTEKGAMSNARVINNKIECQFLYKGEWGGYYAPETEKKIKDNKIAELIDELEFFMLPRSKEILIKKAIYHYNELQMHFGRDNRATEKSDKVFLLRNTQNFVRHEYTNYEYILSYSKGKYKEDAYYALKEYINNKVEEKLNNYEII